MQIGADHDTIERICQPNSMTVKPNERVLLHTVYDAVAQDLGRDFKMRAAAVVMAAYSPDAVQHNIRPGRDHCCLFAPRI